MSKVLLYSGGMDSWLIDKLWKPDIKLFIRIHTANNELEYQRLCYLMEKGYVDKDSVKIVEMDLSMFERADQNYFLPLRNLHFVTMAAHFGDEICLGATGSSTHFDKTLPFAEKASDVISYLQSEKGEGPVKIVLPFKDTTKTELLRMYIEQGGDINKAYEQTVSCYTPCDGKPCMSCTSCTSKFVAFYNNGYKFSDEDISKFVKYVESHKEMQKPDVIKLYDRLK